jgi:hypothetical protein
MLCIRMGHMRAHPYLPDNNIPRTLGVRNGNIISNGHTVTICMNALSRELETFLASLARQDRIPLG